MHRASCITHIVAPNDRETLSEWLSASARDRQSPPFVGIVTENQRAFFTSPRTMEKECRGIRRFPL